MQGWDGEEGTDDGVINKYGREERDIMEGERREESRKEEKKEIKDERAVNRKIQNK